MTQNQNKIVETKIFDNWMDEAFTEYVYNKILNLPHQYGHKSTPEAQPFYSLDLSIDDDITRFICSKIAKTLDLRFSPLRVYANIQWPGMNGEYHDDDGEMTCLWMISPTLEESGEFEIKNEKKIKFLFNRFISFSAYKTHRGLAPAKGVRITIAVKCKIYGI